MMNNLQLAVTGVLFIFAGMWVLVALAVILAVALTVFGYFGRLGMGLVGRLKRLM